MRQHETGAGISKTKFPDLPLVVNIIDGKVAPGFGVAGAGDG